MSRQWLEAFKENFLETMECKHAGQCSIYTIPADLYLRARDDSHISQVKLVRDSTKI